MENFRTEFLLKPSNLKISHTTPILTIGSCFSENMGNFLLERKFPIQSNPYGILFNPISIANALKDIANKRIFEGSDLIEHNKLFHSFWHHSQFSGSDKEVTLNHINQKINETHAYLKQCKFLFITLGTAWAYNYVGEMQNFKGLTVANCHKIPSSVFEKKLLSVEVIVEALKNAVSQVQAINSEIEIIFTLSPVRHLKDGFEENQLSKSILRLAIHHLNKTLKNSTYFPAYELIIDDLRDYRFFEEDMVHPNALAVKYVWHKFKTHYFEPKTIENIAKIEQFKASLSHKPFHPNSEAHLSFLQKLQNDIALFEKETNIKIQ
jgi:hypothetical protein